jgi:hypothetical protein
MKTNYTLKSLPIVSAAVAAMFCGFCGSGAFADTPAPFKLDNAMLGRLDALLTVCSKADPKNKPSYDRYRNDMIEFGTGKQALRVEGSDTPEYKAAYDEVVQATGKATRQDIVLQCVRSVGLEAEGGHAP